MKDIKKMPSSKDSEEYVLGAIMLEPACLPLVVSSAHEDVFYFELHRRVFKAISSLYDESLPVEVISVVEKMKRLGLLSATITPFDVTKITNSVVSSANIEAHILILQQYYLQREAIRMGVEMTNRGYEEDPFDLLDNTAAQIMKLQERATKGNQRSIGDYVVQVNQERAAISKNGGVIGTSTGLPPLDEVISGLVAPDLIILASRPGMGKTAKALTIVRYVAVELMEPVAIFSLEMSASQLVTRLESIESVINHDYIRKNRLEDSDRYHLKMADERLTKAPIYIDDTANINIRELRSKASILKKKFGIRHIVVDYLQLMSGINDRGKPREQVISEISRGLKVIAKELNCTVIALSQLSREVEKRPDKIPQLSDLRESGSIEQDADVVIFLMRPDYYEVQDTVSIGGIEHSPKDLVVTKIAKNRHGDTKSIPLYFDAPKMRFRHTYEFMPDPSKFRVLRDFTEPADQEPF